LTFDVFNIAEMFFLRGFDDDASVQGNLG